MTEREVHFITGAGSGMGRLAAQRALAAGAAVAAVDINEAGLNQLEGQPDNLLRLVVDITDFEAVKAAVIKTEQQLDPITRVMNAAAIMPYGLLEQQDNATIHRIMAINYGGLVNVAQATFPLMKRRGRGQFISFSSLAGHIPLIYVGAYNASKFAVTAFTEVLHHENRDCGVQVLCVCPPAVNTPLLDQGRATIWPKSLDLTPPIRPEQVLDAIDRAIEKGRFWVFPGLLANIYYRLRRWAPRFGWWLNHRLEGR